MNERMDGWMALCRWVFSIFLLARFSTLSVIANYIFSMKDYSGNFFNFVTPKSPYFSQQSEPLGRLHSPTGHVSRCGVKRNDDGDE